MPPKISTYMSKPVITVSKDDNLYYVRNLMIRHRISRVVVTEGNVISGIISKSDFIRILYNKKRCSKPLTRIYAYEIMSSPVYAIQSSKTIKAAANAMLRRNIGSLLVIENGKLLGIITKTDLVRAFAERYEGKFKVSEFMHRRVPTTTPAHTVYHVITLMQDTGMGKVVVTDERNHVVGVLTKSDIMFMGINPLIRGNIDIIKRLGLTGGDIDFSFRICILPLVGDIMTRDPLVVSPDDDLSIAADIMVKHRLGTLPVVNDSDELVGLLTKDCVIKALKSA